MSVSQSTLDIVRLVLRKCRGASAGDLPFGPDPVVEILNLKSGVGKAVRAKPRRAILELSERLSVHLVAGISIGCPMGSFWFLWISCGIFFEIAHALGSPPSALHVCTYQVPERKWGLTHIVFTVNLSTRLLLLCKRKPLRYATRHEFRR